LGAVGRFYQMSMGMPTNMRVSLKHCYVMPSTKLRRDYIPGYAASNNGDFHLMIFMLTVRSPN